MFPKKGLPIPVRKYAQFQNLMIGKLMPVCSSNIRRKNKSVILRGVTYEFKLGAQKLRFRGNVKNLANTQYVIARDSFGYGWGIGRTFNAGVQVNF